MSKKSVMFIRHFALLTEHVWTGLYEVLQSGPQRYTRKPKNLFPGCVDAGIGERYWKIGKSKERDVKTKKKLIAMKRVHLLRGWW